MLLNKLQNAIMYTQSLILLCLVTGIHMTQPWFHSGLTREETHALFTKQGMVDGMFLVRESQRIPGAFVLSFSHNQKVKHYQINMVSTST